MRGRVSIGMCIECGNAFYKRNPKGLFLYYGDREIRRIDSITCSKHCANLHKGKYIPVKFKRAVTKRAV